MNGFPQFRKALDSSIARDMATRRPQPYRWLTSVAGWRLEPEGSARTYSDYGMAGAGLLAFVGTEIRLRWRHELFLLSAVTLLSVCLSAGLFPLLFSSPREWLFPLGAEMGFVIARGVWIARTGLRPIRENELKKIKEWGEADSQILSSLALWVGELNELRMVELCRLAGYWRAQKLASVLDVQARKWVTFHQKRNPAIPLELATAPWGKSLGSPEVDSRPARLPSIRQMKQWSISTEAACKILERQSILFEGALGAAVRRKVLEENLPAEVEEKPRSSRF